MTNGPPSDQAQVVRALGNLPEQRAGEPAAARLAHMGADQSWLHRRLASAGYPHEDPLPCRLRRAPHLHPLVLRLAGPSPLRCRRPGTGSCRAAGAGAMPRSGCSRYGRWSSQRPGHAECLLSLTPQFSSPGTRALTSQSSRSGRWAPFSLNTGGSWAVLVAGSSQTSRAWTRDEGT